jgi:membrane protein
MTRFYAKFREAIGQALSHDIVNTAKAAAYSGMLMLFPAMLVITTLVARVQEGPTLVGEMRAIFDQFLPADTLDLLQSYVLTHSIHSASVILSASGLSVFAGLGVMLSLMEGFRRAYRLPPNTWGFWSRRLRALLLVLVAGIPLSVATMMIVFGHQIEQWIVEMAGHELRQIVLFFWRMVRWTIAVSTSLTVLTILYHFGTRRKEHWVWVGPGAIAATAIWFPATLAYGWYVLHDANYSRFYGPFANGIVTLVWLYISSFSVLLGAEFNGVLYGNRHKGCCPSGAVLPSALNQSDAGVSSFHHSE